MDKPNVYEEWMENFYGSEDEEACVDYLYVTIYCAYICVYYFSCFSFIFLREQHIRLWILHLYNFFGFLINWSGDHSSERCYFWYKRLRRYKTLSRVRICFSFLLILTLYCRKRRFLIFFATINIYWIELELFHASEAPFRFASIIKVI